MNTWVELLKNKPVLICAYPVKELALPMVPSACEALELRLDYLNDLEYRVDDVKNFIKRVVSQYPTVITIRSIDEGGINDVDLNVKLELLSYGKFLGALIDVETQLLISNSNNPSLSNIASNAIVSRHIFNENMSIKDYLMTDLEVARKVNALVYKVFTVRDDDYPDMVKLLMESKEINVAIIPMKPRLRASAMLLGTTLMYCSMNQSTAPGQLGVEQCIKLKGLLKDLNN